MCHTPYGLHINALGAYVQYVAGYGTAMKAAVVLGQVQAGALAVYAALLAATLLSHHCSSSYCLIDLAAAAAACCRYLSITHGLVQCGRTGGAT
jgi:purine-cytosine permease-like protein